MKRPFAPRTWVLLLAGTALSWTAVFVAWWALTIAAGLLLVSAAVSHALPDRRTPTRPILLSGPELSRRCDELMATRPEEPEPLPDPLPRGLRDPGLVRGLALREAPTGPGASSPPPRPRRPKPPPGGGGVGDARFGAAPPLLDRQDEYVAERRKFHPDGSRKSRAAVLVSLRDTEQFLSYMMITDPSDAVAATLRDVRDEIARVEGVERLAPGGPPSPSPSPAPLVAERPFAGHTHCPHGHVGVHHVGVAVDHDDTRHVRRTCRWELCAVTWLERAYDEEAT